MLELEKLPPRLARALGGDRAVEAGGGDAGREEAAGGAGNVAGTLRSLRLALLQVRERAVSSVKEPYSN